MPRVLVALLAAVVLLLGCTAEEEAAPAAPPAAAPLPAETTLVALGDSLATGAGASTSYVLEYAERLESAHDVTVTVDNRARGGWTSADLLRSLTEDEGMREAVSGADVVTLDIGGNDLLRARFLHATGACGGEDGERCLREVVDGVTGRWSAILDEVLALRATDDVRVRAIDLYHPFVAQEQAAGTFEALLPYFEAANGAIRDEAEARGVPVADVTQAFHGDDWDDPAAAGLISSDRLHPSDAGHALIADRLTALDPAP